MDKKTVLQLITLLFISIILIFVFNKYFKSKKIVEGKIDIKKEESNLENQTEFSNILRDVSYSTLDLDRNKYEIYAKFGEIDPNDPAIIFMREVEAKITLNNSDEIIIMSKKAKYNNTSYETNFSQKINVSYGEHIIDCNFIDLNIEENFLTLYENLVYKGTKGNIKADRLNIDLLTNDIQIIMDNKNSDVKIKINET